MAHIAAPARFAASAPGREITLTFSDPTSEVASVRLVSELWKRERPKRFTRLPGAPALWQLRFARPAAVDRMEYQLELMRRRGAVERVPDPANPLRAPGPFGERSVLEFPEYARPAWIDDGEAPPGGTAPLALPARGLRERVDGLLWSSPSAEPGRPLPLLVVHDGPEYAEYSLLTRLLASATAELELPPLRAALLAPPGDRDETYSASARYAAALARDVLPALARLAPAPPGRSYRVGMGASLGALAALHAHRLHPETFGGLFLQSGSYFRLRSDRQEAGFPRFARIARFVRTVLTAAAWPDPVPVALTCGIGEENLASNRALRDALAHQGYPAELDEHRDAHNWISWRDSLDPHLVSLLQRLWS